jgi:hypothetical protein
MKPQFVYRPGAIDGKGIIEVFRNGLPFGTIFVMTGGTRYICHFTNGGTGPEFASIKDVQANIEASATDDE